MGDYNLFAETYAKETAENKAEIKSRRHYHSLLLSLKGKSVLDVGCGSGLDAKHYFKNGARVFGLDISEKEIEMARRLGVGQFVTGDMNALPYPSESFDLVTSYYALQASRDVPRALDEMVRVVKSGGTILVLAKHPLRNLLEGWYNDGRMDYFRRGIVTSHILNRTITLKEPAHTLDEYFNKGLLGKVELVLFEEHSDFPASDQVVSGLNYPTYFIMKLRKK